MFGSLFRRHASNAPVLVTDIDTGTAAAGVVVPSSEGSARVIVAQRSEPALEKRTPDQAKSASTSSLADITKKVIEQYAASEEGKKLGPVQNLQCIVGPSLSRSRTVQKKEQFEQERSITDALIQEFAHTALQAPSELDASNILETNVTRVLLNDYPTSKPVGKHALSLCVTAFQSDIAAGTRASIEQALGMHAPGRPVDIRSQTRAVMTVLHEHSASLEQYLLVTVGGTATHCSAVREDALTQHATTDTGAVTILTNLAGEGSPDETLSLLRMVARDACSDEACEKFETALAQAETTLVKTFGEVFAQLTAVQRVPNECLLITRTELAPWFENFFARLDFSQFSVTSQPLNVTPLTADHLQEFVTWSPGIREDTGLGIAAAFVNINQQG